MSRKIARSRWVCVPAAFATLASGANAQSDQRVVVPLSDPDRPATLEVSLFNGSITVNAYDGDEIVIVMQNTDEETPPDVNRNGLRRIPSTSVGLTAEERNNTVSIAVDWGNRNLDLDISVPRQTSVHASTVHGNELTIVGVSGQHELSNVQGEISATDIAGSAVVNTTNGNVRVSFTEITADAPMSFTSFNGNVEVTFPQTLAADLRINAGNGEVLTDFDVVIQPQTSVVDQSGDAGRYRVRLERETRAIVGGGGPEIQFKTFNGDVIIRKR